MAFVVGVLDFLLVNENDLIDFAGAVGLHPAEVGRAREALARARHQHSERHARVAFRLRNASNLPPMKSLRRLAAIGLIIAAVATPAAAAPYFCENGKAPQSGERVEFRFVKLPYVIMAHALAEKACGAKHKPMGPAILGAVEAEGCGPSTDIHREIAETISRIEKADLGSILSDGAPDPSLTQEQVRRDADDMAKQFGGCEQVLKNHDALKP